MTFDLTQPLIWLAGSIGVIVTVVIAVLRKFWKFNVSKSFLRGLIGVVSVGVFYLVTWFGQYEAFSVWAGAIAGLTPITWYHVVLPIVEKIISAILGLYEAKK